MLLHRLEIFEQLATKGEQMPLKSRISAGLGVVFF